MVLRNETLTDAGYYLDDSCKGSRQYANKVVIIIP